MVKRNKLIYLFIALGIVVAFKFGYARANSDSLRILINPISGIVGFFTGSASYYIPGKGYFFNTLGVIIDKSCSGFNFMMVAFVMLSFQGLKYSRTRTERILTLPLAFLIAYLLAVFAGVSRIFSSVMLQKRLNGLLGISSAVVHEVIGIVVYLIVLIGTYFLLEKYSKKNEKP